LYTGPKPPSPIKHSGAKLLVAALSSCKVNVCARGLVSASSRVLGPETLSDSALGLEALSNFDLSAQMIKYYVEKAMSRAHKDKGAKYFKRASLKNTLPIILK